MAVSVCLQIKKISEGLQKRFNARAREYGLTLAQSRVLVYLFEHPDGRITQRDIEKYLGATHVTVSGLVRRLYRNGFVVVKPDPADRRAKNISLDSAYVSALRSAAADEAEGDELLLRGLSNEDRARLAGYLETMYNNVLHAGETPKENQNNA